MRFGNFEDWRLDDARHGGSDSDWPWPRNRLRTSMSRSCYLVDVRRRWLRPDATMPHACTLNRALPQPSNLFLAERLSRCAGDGAGRLSHWNFGDSRAVEQPETSQLELGSECRHPEGYSRPCRGCGTALRKDCLRGHTPRCALRWPIQGSPAATP